MGALRGPPHARLVAVVLTLDSSLQMRSKSRSWQMCSPTMVMAVQELMDPKAPQLPLSLPDAVCSGLHWVRSGALQGAMGAIGVAYPSCRTRWMRSPVSVATQRGKPMLPQG